MQGGAADSSAQEPRSWTKPFRPVWWWLCFSAVLLAWDYHRRHAPLTHIDFRARVEGAEVPLTTRLDGRVRRSDFAVPLGRTRVTLEAPDVEPWHTNLFVWYGRNDLGEIPLKWQRGTLALQVYPMGDPVELRGPHYQTVLKGSAGLTSSVPVGKYEITAQRGRYLLRRELTVTPGATSEAIIRFEYGAVSFASDPPGAVIENAAGERFGETPLTMAEVQPGQRRYLARLPGHANHEWRVEVRARETNRLTANLFTERYVQAMGVAKSSMEGSFPNLERALEQVEIALKDHPADESALKLRQRARFEIALRDGQRLAGEGNFVQALEKLAEALQLQPDEPRALELRSTWTRQLAERKAAELEQTTRELLDEAGAAADRNNFAKALATLDRLEQIRPGEARAKSLREKIQSAQAAFIQASAKAKAEARIRFPAEYSRQLLETKEDASLFETVHWTYTADLDRVDNAIRDSIGKHMAKMTITEQRRLNEDTRMIYWQPKAYGLPVPLLGEMTGGAMGAGVVFGRINDTEVEVHLKFWHYGFSQNVQITNGKYSPGSFKAASDILRKGHITQFKKQLDRLITNP